MLLQFIISERKVLRLLVFRGIQKTTLIDFPGKVACTLFLPKCNFRCPFCYNARLVLDGDTGVEISEKEAIAFLSERKKFLDGVCITGGEPLLHPGIVSFCAKAKQLGLLVKLDTNGSNPLLLKKLLEERLLDFIAMDIKSSQGKYNEAAGAKVDLNAIGQSIALIRQSGVDYEFRSTIVPCLHKREDLLEIGQWLKGSKRFVLQQFHSDARLLDPRLEGTKQYTREEMLGFVEMLKPFFQEAKARGL